MTSLNSAIVDEITQTLQQSKSEYDTLIESGTLGGETIINLQPYFRTLHTIELSQHYYEYFDQIKEDKKYQNVINHFGDTAKVLPTILKTLSSRNKVIFWLDGHYSSYDTAKGDKDCPLIEECLSIDSLYSSNKGIVLIDDYRLFGTKQEEDWSDITVENILKCFVNHSVKSFVNNDIFVLYIEK
jgi:hypothetical protein